MTARPDEVVAEICDVWELRWAGHDSIASIASKNKLKPGDFLVPLAALQSANARLAKTLGLLDTALDALRNRDKRLGDVLALADGLSITAVNAAESARKDHEGHNFVRQAASEMQSLMARRTAADIRRAAAGEGDAKQGDTK